MRSGNQKTVSSLLLSLRLLCCRYCYAPVAAGAADLVCLGTPRTRPRGHTQHRAPERAQSPAYGR
eukprot:6263589-Alexandrium_andersonii.AAC.1